VRATKLTQLILVATRRTLAIGTHRLPARVGQL